MIFATLVAPCCYLVAGVPERWVRRYDEFTGIIMRFDRHREEKRRTVQVGVVTGMDVSRRGDLGILEQA